MVGKNPLCRGDAVMTWQQEWASIQGLRRALQSPPRKTGSDQNGRTQWETVSGPYWTPQGAGHDYVGRLAAEMQANVYDLGFLRDSDGKAVVLDCGANVGFFSRFAFTSGAGRVIAFEPSPENAACLGLNLASEIAAGKATIVKKGLWDRETILAFSTGNVNNPGGHHIVENGSGDIQVPVTSIDRVCDEFRLSRVDYIKMDVEGAEVRALNGATDTIRKFHPRLCVATEHTDDLFANTVAVIETVKKIDAGYRYLCAENHLWPSPSRGSVLTPFSLLFY